MIQPLLDLLVMNTSLLKATEPMSPQMQRAFAAEIKRHVTDINKVNADLLEACEAVLAEWESEIYLEIDESVGATGPVLDSEPIKLVRAAIRKAGGNV
jgi:hypothetical protein